MQVFIIITIIIIIIIIALGPLFGLGRLFSFLILYTVGMTPRKEIPRRKTATYTQGSTDNVNAHTDNHASKGI
jgi:hypothetical protein